MPTKLSLALKSADLKMYEFLMSPIRATCLVHLILLDLITIIVSGEEHKWLQFSLKLTGLYVYFLAYVTVQYMLQYVLVVHLTTLPVPQTM
jgi:hypothetical protein